jgi:hypothetical protein
MLIGYLEVGPQAIAPQFLAKIVAPYKPTGTDYLREASVIQRYLPPDAELDSLLAEPPIITTRGQFSIPTSCYIQSTGHFNAVEYLICFNQLAYTTFGYLIKERVWDDLPDGRISSACRAELAGMTIDRFFSKQLSSMLILKTETRFTRVIDANDFHAELAVQSLFYRKGTVFTQTTCRFSDAQGGSADGTVLLAYPTNMGA